MTQPGAVHDKMNRRRGQGKEGERRQKRKEERPYHDTMPRRVEAVLRANGGHTKY